MQGMRQVQIIVTNPSMIQGQLPVPVVMPYPAGHPIGHIPMAAQVVADPDLQAVAPPAAAPLQDREVRVAQDAGRPSRRDQRRSREDPPAALELASTETATVPPAPERSRGRSERSSASRLEQQFDLRYNTLLNLLCHAMIVPMPRDSYQQYDSFGAGDKRERGRGRQVDFVCTQIFIDAEGREQAYTGDPAPTKREARAASSFKLLKSVLGTTDPAEIEAAISRHKTHGQDERRLISEARAEERAALQNPPRPVSTEEHKQMIELVLSSIPANPLLFVYGEWMWELGDQASQVPAVLDGYMRDFCVTDSSRWGSESNPGLAMALRPQEGARCAGMLVHMNRESLIELLSSMESDSHRPRVVQVQMQNSPDVCDVSAAEPEPIEAVTLVANELSPGYSLQRPFSMQARLVGKARGSHGANFTLLCLLRHELAKLGREDQIVNKLFLAAQDYVWPVQQLPVRSRTEREPDQKNG